MKESRELRNLETWKLVLIVIKQHLVKSISAQTEPCLCL